MNKDHFHLGEEAEQTLHSLDVPVPVPLELTSSLKVDADGPEAVNPKDALGLQKPDMSVVPPTAELHLASAMMDGAVKYGPFNWRDKPVQARIYYAAARRHLVQWLDGEDFDPVSNVHHLGHAMACCAILLDAYELGVLKDDRPLPGPAPEMVRNFSNESKFRKLVRKIFG